jgi:hypothetical protein
VIVVDDLGIMVERLLNPGVIITLVVSGLAYGVILWALHIRPNVALWAMATWPGALFIILIGLVRFGEGSTSVLYPVLLIAWLVFSNTAFVFVLARRWWKKR